ncbi:hypothetical protein GIB67_010431 [Kingdonia uniflora]|uniref:F-box/kelch-repeat protein n=1 Tax=Kingdonia uniflora TaxID=39325 RepID=A0A7J7MAF1_9MAGN|nr:hypothetical protein GIB67_010431 [Kingdonia uniflora]
MLFSRKKFAAATIHGKIYVSGGSGTTGTVEEYDPSSDTWRIVSEGSRRRYGCIGASVGGVFYVIGGLKIGRAGPGTHEAYVYASSMDAYDVMSRVWLRTRAVPGGGCVVAACTANGYVYVLASHTVELSFWRYEGKGKEWCRIRSPPLPAQVRIDGSVRFSCVGVDNKRVLLVQMLRGFKRGLVLVYDSEVGEWSRVADLPDVIKRPACVSVEC